jgi:hypothetical protein
MENAEQKDPQSKNSDNWFGSRWMRSKVLTMNDAFNSLPITTRRRVAIICGIGAALTIVMLTVLHFYTTQENIPHAETITLPLDINQHPDMEQHNATTLAPLGKMKGEIDDKFEAFYLAVDNEGTVFINRDPPYGADRFLKTNGWEAITMEQLREYEKHLHFIPQNNRKGLTP